jgi:hypothetical protein
MKALFLACLASLMLVLSSPSLQAAELAGVTVADEITLANGETLKLNGMGLREKMWIDVYVGSLYLAQPVDNVAAILAQPGALRIQMNFVYKEVSSEKMIKSWNEGFTNNQNAETLAALKDRIDAFNALFSDSARMEDVYTLDYLPGTGTVVSKNAQQLGIIEGEDFRNALVEIWLGNSPADSDLKRGMLGQE